jgi:hypothetical protein
MSDTPKGWKLVPILARKEMIVAANKHYESEEYTGVSSTYEAMLAASPTPPEAQGESVRKEVLELLKKANSLIAHIDGTRTAISIGMHSCLEADEWRKEYRAIIPSIEQREG